MHYKYLIKTLLLSQEGQYSLMEAGTLRCTLSCHNIFGTVIISLKSTAFALDFRCARKNN